MPRPILTCQRCQHTFTDPKYQKPAPRFCSRACRYDHLSEQRRGTHGYVKRRSTYIHRLRAAQLLGRPLLRGEIVGFADGNPRNLADDNLIVFEDRSEFSRWVWKRRKAQAS